MVIFLPEDFCNCSLALQYKQWSIFFCRRQPSMHTGNSWNLGNSWNSSKVQPGSTGTRTASGTHAGLILGWGTSDAT